MNSNKAPKPIVVPNPPPPPSIDLGLTAVENQASPRAAKGQIKSNLSALRNDLTVPLTPIKSSGLNITL